MDKSNSEISVEFFFGFSHFHILLSTKVQAGIKKLGKSFATFTTAATTTTVTATTATVAATTTTTTTVTATTTNDHIFFFRKKKKIDNKSIKGIIKALPRITYTSILFRYYLKSYFWSKCKKNFVNEVDNVFIN